MSKFGEFESYLGVSDKIFYRGPSPSGFFRRFDSKEDFFLRALCIVTAPLIHLVSFPMAVIMACIKGLKALIAFITSNPTDLTNAKRDCKSNMLDVCKAPIQAVLSPFVNFVDFVGSVVTTAIPKKKEPEWTMR